MCKDAPSPDPAIGEAARMNAETAKEALSFYRDTYQNVIAPQMERDIKMREGLTADLRNIMGRQQSMAEEQYATYKDNYLPVEKQAIQDASQYDAAENVNRRSGIAAASVNQQFSNAQQQGARSLSRYGINPNSGAFARENAKLMTQQALASSGAQTGAALETMDKAVALRAGVADRGRGVTGTIGNFLNSAANTGSQTGNISAQGMGVTTQGINTMNQGFNTSIAGNQSAGNLMLGDFQGRMQGYQADQQMVGGLFQGIGMAAGGYFGMPKAPVTRADGGLINGPGGPRDDMVPVLASDGEFVLNEGAVKHFGLAKLNKMNEVGLKNQQARGLRG